MTGLVATVLLHLLLLLVLLLPCAIRIPSATPSFEVELGAPEEPLRPPVEPEKKEVKLPEVVRKPTLIQERLAERTSSGASPQPIAPPAPTKAATIDNTGDVEVQQKNQRAIDNRGLYQSDDSGTVTATPSGERDAKTLYRGTSEGRDVNNHADEVSSFNLNGRTVVGKLGQPENRTNKEGRVVVEITVDRQGKVIQAKAIAKGSTVQDATLWRAAEEAARETTFNTDAKVVQSGTITYIFKLR